MEQVVDRINLVKQVFNSLEIDWVEPYETTEGAINRKETGNHRGLYYIYPEVNFYFGKAATNTVINRHNTHRPKLDVNLSKLYGSPVEKKEPGLQFPQGWQEGVRKFIINEDAEIPAYYVKTDRGTVVPGQLDYKVTHKVDVDTLPVILWNLDHLTPEQISSIEEGVIEALMPYCNTEAYRARQKA